MALGPQLTLLTLRRPRAEGGLLTQFGANLWRGAAVMLAAWPGTKVPGSRVCACSLQAGYFG